MDDTQLAWDYGVHALPALLLFHKGDDEPVIFAGLKNGRLVCLFRPLWRLQKRFDEGVRVPREPCQEEPAADIEAIYSNEQESEEPSEQLH